MALLSALTALTKFILKGNCPASIRPSFFGATLIALEKKDGGIRPIAMGCTLRRLSAKAAGRHISDTVGTPLTSHQLGVGTPYWAETAIHAARLYLQNLETNQVILKLDFKNAFNNILRDRMLKAVMELAPDLFPLVHSAYSSPSLLFWGDKLLQSAEGMQQGDPFGPLLFCLTINHLVLQMRSEFCAWYLDDGTLGDSSDDVLDDLQVVEKAAELVLLTSSCPGPWPDLMVTSPDKATLLRAPLGDVDSILEAILEKTRKLRIMGERLQHFHAHYTFLLLRHSIAIPKLLYTLRTSPCFLSPELSEYYSLLRSIASSLVNIHFQDNDSAWLQASLPVNQGGLGIRSAGQLAPSAFLASTAASSTLAHLMLPHASTLSPSRMRLFSTGLKAMSNHPLHQKRLTSRSHGIPQELKRRWSSSWTMHLTQDPAPAS